MDARTWEESQSHQASIKRPWEEDIALPEQGNASYPGILPAADAAPYRRPSIQRGVEHSPILDQHHGSDHRELSFKKARFERHEHANSPRQNHSSNPRIPPPPPPPPNISTYCENRASASSESPPLPLTAGLAESPGISKLCQRCHRLTSEDKELDPYGVPSSCEQCRNNPELFRVTQDAAAALTQLVETLSSGISSGQRGIIRKPVVSVTADYPPVAQFGLKHTLSWILGTINRVNYLADDLVRQVPAGTLPRLNKELFKDGFKFSDGSLYIMKRQNDVDPDEVSRSRGAESIDSMPDLRTHSRRRSSTSAPLVRGGDELPSMRRFQPELYQNTQPLDEEPHSKSYMNPPRAPAQSRQLPSPPGRSLPSPSSINFPSPLTPSFGGTQQATKLPPPLTLQLSSSNSYLPPMSTSRSPDPALRDYSASLQHEVSLQKIAFSSLQGEHDKLLAAFSRSQTRASALEKKHAVSDNEIITLSEEKMRLQQQVIDLEQDVEELSRSKDEIRQAAVQEVSQYVKIVEKASQLEEKTNLERKVWEKIKADMEQRIETLTGRESSSLVVTSMKPAEEVGAQSIDGSMNTNTPESSIDIPAELKVESPINLRLAGPTSHPAEQAESANDLRTEIRRLQSRCIEMENALRAVDNDGRSIEGLLKRVLEKAGSALAD